MYAAVLNVALRALSSGSRFVLFGALARYLPVEDVGRFGVVLATVSLAAFALGCELHSVLARKLLALPAAERPVLVQSQLRFHLLSYAAALPLLAVPCALDVLPWSMFGWIAALSASEHFGRELQRLLVTMGRPLAANALLFVRGGAWVMVWLAAALIAPAARALHVLWPFWLAGALASIVLGVWALRALLLPLRGPLANAHSMLVLCRSAAPLYAAVIAQMAMFMVDRYALLHWHGEAAVGPYAFFAGVAALVVVVSETAVIAIMGPGLIETYQRGMAAEHAALMRTFALAVSAVVLTCVVALALGTDLLLLVAHKSAYAEARATYWALLGAMGVLGLGAIPNYALYVRQLDRAILFANVTGFAVFVAALLALAPARGHLGVALAVAAGTLTIASVQSAAWILGPRRAVAA